MSVAAVEVAAPGAEQAAAAPLAVVERGLRSFMADFEPRVFSGEDAAALMERFAQIERLAAAGKAMAAARAAECGTWRRSGARSAAEWVGHRTGSTVRDAANQLATAKRMQGLGEAADAYRQGELSPAAASAVAAAASADPASETALLTAARCEPVETLKARADETVRRAVADHRERSERLWRSRSLRTWRDADGAHITQLRLPPELGALFGAGWRRYLHDAEAAARDRGDRCHSEALAADAAVMMAQHHCRATCSDAAGVTNHLDMAGSSTRSGCSSTRADAAAVTNPLDSTKSAHRSDDHPSTHDVSGSLGRDSCDGGELGRRKAPVQVIARVDLDALLRGHTADGEVCEIAGVGPVPVTAIENLLGSATLALVLTRGVDVLNVTHLGRAATVHQQTALCWRDPTCVVEGCHEQLDLEIDHVTGWGTTHTTRLDDLARLCRAHHAYKTHRGWILTPPDPTTGKRQLVPPQPHDTS